MVEVDGHGAQLACFQVNELRVATPCLLKSHAPVGAKATPLSPPEIAGLTRLALSFALGRGSVCPVTRSFSLQLYQPHSAEDYIWYQWRRISVFLPKTKPPRLHEALSGTAIDPQEKDDKAAQWRLRVSSIHLQVARRLLYPQPNSSQPQITSDALSLLGVEAMACLWADRGRLVQPRGNPHAQGRLNLSRYDWRSAATFQQWIAALAGAHGQVAANPRNPASPMLFFDHQAVTTLIGMMGETWMANASCLKARFQLKAAREWSEQMLGERLAAYTPPPVDLAEELNRPIIPKLKAMPAGRRAPQLPPDSLVPSAEQAVQEA